jgi:hypothetical protein
MQGSSNELDLPFSLPNPASFPNPDLEVRQPGNHATKRLHGKYLTAMIFAIEQDRTMSVWQKLIVLN